MKGKFLIRFENKKKVRLLQTLPISLLQSTEFRKEDVVNFLSDSRQLENNEINQWQDLSCWLRC